MLAAPARRTRAVCQYSIMALFKKLSVARYASISTLNSFLLSWGFHQKVFLLTTIQFLFLFWLSEFLLPVFYIIT